LILCSKIWLAIQKKPVCLFYYAKQSRVDGLALFQCVLGLLLDMGVGACGYLLCENIFSQRCSGKSSTINKWHKFMLLYVTTPVILKNALFIMYCVKCLCTWSLLLYQNVNIWFVGAPSKHAAIPNASNPKLVTWTGKPTRQTLL